MTRTKHTPRQRRAIERSRKARMETLKLAGALALCVLLVSPLAFIVGAAAGLSF